MAGLRGELQLSDILIPGWALQEEKHVSAENCFTQCICVPKISLGVLGKEGDAVTSDTARGSGVKHDQPETNVCSSAGKGCRNPVSRRGEQQRHRGWKHPQL